MTDGCRCPLVACLDRRCAQASAVEVTETPAGARLRWRSVVSDGSCQAACAPENERTAGVVVFAAWFARVFGRETLTFVKPRVSLHLRVDAEGRLRGSSEGQLREALKSAQGGPVAAVITVPFLPGDKKSEKLWKQLEKSKIIRKESEEKGKLVPGSSPPRYVNVKNFAVLLRYVPERAD